MEDVVEPRAREIPESPSTDEWAKHQLTHFPFRSWCSYCVSGRSRDDPHRAAETAEEGMPVLEVDFFFMGIWDDLEEAISLTIVDCPTGNVACTGLPSTSMLAVSH